MQKILRKLRWDNSKNSNYTEYTLFALLEVVLIVIGIFLAIQLDNKNNQIKIKSDVEVILHEIMKDLSLDIKSSSRIFNRYVDHNKTSDVIFNPSSTNEDFILKSSKISQLLGYYINYNIHNKGFDALKKLNEELPNEYVEIYENLNKFYDISINIDVYNKRYQKTIYNTFDYLVNNFDWYNRDGYNNEIGQEQIEYFTSSRCKSQTHLILNDIANEYYVTSSFRKDAIDLYNELHQLLSDTSKIPKHVNYKILDINKFEPLVGLYVSVDKSDTEIEIFIEDNLLMYSSNYSDTIPLLKFKTNLFYMYRRSHLFEFNADNELLIINEGITRNELFVKIDVPF